MFMFGFKRYTKDVSACGSCPEFKRDWYCLFAWGASGSCRKGNIRIYDSSGGIPKDCPLENTP